MGKIEGEKMAISEEEAKSGDAFAKTIESLDEGTLLKNLTSCPYLFENRAVKERLRTVSQDCKRKIETNDKTLKPNSAF